MMRALEAVSHSPTPIDTVRSVMMRHSYPLRLEPLEVRETPAAAGTLDPTFGTGGAVVLTNSFFGGDSAVDSLGRVVVVGRTGSLIGTGDFAVLRLNPNGTPDPTFGTNGLVTVDFGTDDHPSGVAI